MVETRAKSCDFYFYVQEVLSTFICSQAIYKWTRPLGQSVPAETPELFAGTELTVEAVADPLPIEHLSVHVIPTQ